LIGISLGLPRKAAPPESASERVPVPVPVPVPVGDAARAGEEEKNFPSLPFPLPSSGEVLPALFSNSTFTTTTSLPGSATLATARACVWPPRKKKKKPTHATHLQVGIGLVFSIGASDDPADPRPVGDLGQLGPTLGRRRAARSMLLLVLQSQVYLAFGRGHEEATFAHELGPGRRGGRYAAPIVRVLHTGYETSKPDLLVRICSSLTCFERMCSRLRGGVVLDVKGVLDGVLLLASDRRLRDDDDTNVVASFAIFSK